MRATDRDIALALGKVAEGVKRLGGSTDGWAADPAPDYGGWALFLPGGHFAGGAMFDANRMGKTDFWRALRLCADVLHQIDQTARAGRTACLMTPSGPPRPGGQVTLTSPPEPEGR